MSENIQRVLLGAASMGSVDFVREAIGNGADPKANDSEALCAAAESGHVACVNLLIPLSDPTAYPLALKIAAGEGHPECVQALIAVTDPKANHSMALQYAACCGQWDCIRLLLPLSDLADMQNDGEWLMQDHGVANLQAFIAEEELRNGVVKTAKKNAKPNR